MRSIDPFFAASGPPDGVGRPPAALGLDPARRSRRSTRPTERRLTQALLSAARRSRRCAPSSSRSSRRRAGRSRRLGLDAQELANLQNASGRAGSPASASRSPSATPRRIERARGRGGDWRKGVLEGLHRLEEMGLIAGSIQWFESPRGHPRRYAGGVGDELPARPPPPRLRLLGRRSRAAKVSARGHPLARRAGPRPRHRLPDGRRGRRRGGRGPPGGERGHDPLRARGSRSSRRRTGGRAPAHRPSRRPPDERPGRPTPPTSVPTRHRPIEEQPWSGRCTARTSITR